MLSSTKGWDYFAILSEMDTCGYDAEWQTFNSKDYGVPQNRVRIYTIGHNRDYGEKQVYPICPPDGTKPVLADILQCDVPEKYYLKKEQVEKIVFEKPKNGTGIIGHRDGYRRNLQTFTPDKHVEALDTAQGGGRGHHVAEQLSLFAEEPFNGGFVDLTAKDAKVTDTARCLKARYDAGVTNRNGDNSGVAQPVCIDPQGRLEKEVTPSDTVPTLRAQTHGNEPKVCMPVLTPDRGKKRQNGRRMKDDGEDSFTLTATDRHGVAESIPQLMGGIGDKNYGKQFRQQNRIYDSETVSPSLCSTNQWWYGVAAEEFSKDVNKHANHQQDNVQSAYGDCRTIPAGTHASTPHLLKTAEVVETPYQGDGIWVDMGGFKVWAIWYEQYQCYITVRRLTPTECYRLQGWTDEYFERSQFVNSDSQLYKTAGNGITVNVVKVIGKRLNEVLA